MVVVDYFTGRRIKYYSLTMNLTRCSKIPNGVVFFLNHLGDRYCQRTKCNGWKSHFICGHLIEQFKFIMILWSSILSLESSSSKNYYWFLQYMGNDNGNVRNILPSLDIMYFESFYFIISFYFYFVNHFLWHNFYTWLYLFICPCFLVLTFVCS